MEPTFTIGSRPVGAEHPSYFIADIAANHDGDLDRARMLIRQAAAAGAHAAKFQNFRAAHIVSDFGFKNLTSGMSHQATWKKSVFEVYQDASVSWDWTPILQKECLDCGIDYFSTPYDIEAVKMLAPYVPAFKIGSGDITWSEMLEAVARQGKPVLVAAGASTMDEVRRAMAILQKNNPSVCLMQCNTNYTGSLENFKHIHLRVLETFRREFPEVVLGLSDHTPGHTTVLGSVVLGARVIEKHFTDDTEREGPDHHFSMTPATWRAMVDAVQEMEFALGGREKTVADNEKETVVVQRRCVRAAQDLPAGSKLTREMFEVLRPADPGALTGMELEKIPGKTLKKDLRKGQALYPDDFSA